MKTIIRFFIIGGVFLLLGISPISAMGPNDHNHSQMMDGCEVQGMSQHMIVDGSVTVDNSIILSINVSPSQEMIDQMNSRMRGNRHMGNNYAVGDYMNQINVSLYELVEYEDALNDGFTQNDTIVSTYPLDTTTLNQPTVVNDTYYTIKSQDGTTFSMQINLNFEDNLFFGFKWSLEINYPFVSNTSQLAFLHEIETKNGPMVERHQMRYGNMNGGSPMQFEGNHMDDYDTHIPMFFNWATSALVDGVQQSVVATSDGSMFALSVTQGSHIEYDPDIGVDPSSIYSADTSLSSAFQRFIDTLNTPTLIGLGLGLLSLIAIALIAVHLKRKN